MSKKRGLSLEDKREKILEVFHESSDVFVLKDVEKLAARKGVVLQSVKEVLQTLVDDDLVHQEKIGISNYFWSFPAEASVKVCNDVTRIEGELAAAIRRREQIAASLQQTKQGKEDSAERASLLQRMRELEAKFKELQEEAAQFADNDPEALAAMQQGVLAGKEAANRWLDNLLALHSWCRKRFEGREAMLDSFFEENGYSANMEYIE